MSEAAIYKPKYVTHGTEQSSIFSLHVSPDGARLATAGQDCKVRVWNMATIYRDQDMPNDPDLLLSTISHHTAAVNCVRWSPCGSFLATCSDDFTVLVLRLGAQLSYVPLGQKEANKENWDVHRMFRGHAKDVMHVEWSPDGKRLASCGMDGKVVVWMLNGPTDAPPVELRGHNGMVKGLAWDPVGKYLATQGDGGEEKAVVVWRVRDWKMEVKILRPFMSAPDETMFLRLSWSPDGQNLATPNAFVKNRNTCALLERGSGGGAGGEWANNASFMGSSEPVVAASFNPKLLKARAKGGGSQVDACCAVGGSDCTLTVWSATQGGRPIMVVNSLFSKQIVDITWGGKGHTLALCSLDGTVAILELSPDDIGSIASQVETTAELRRLYGESYAAGGGGGGLSQLPEDALQLNYVQQKASAQPKTNGLGGANGASNGAPAQVTTIREAQRETKTANGKRRIMPKVMSDAPQLGAPLPPPPSSSAQPDASLASQADPVTHQRPHTPLAPVAAPSAAPATHAAPSQPHSGQPAGALAPLAGGGAGAEAAGGAGSGSSAAAPAGDGDAAASSSAGGAAAANSGAVVPAAGGDKSKAAGGAGGDKGQESKKRKAQTGKEVGGKEKVPRGGAGGAVQLAAAQPLLTAKPAVNSVERALEGEGDLHLGANRQPDEWTAVTCTSGDGRIVWRDLVPEVPVAVAGSMDFGAVACDNGSLYIFSRAGRRLLPALVLDSRVAVLEAGGSHLLAITTDGGCRVWDAEGLREVCSFSLAPLLRPAGGGGAEATVTSAWLCGKGVPVVCLSSGVRYTYHKDMQAVVRLADPSTFESSSLFSRDPIGWGGGAAGPLARALGGASVQSGVGVPAMIKMDLEQQAAYTVAHAETMVAGAGVLESPQEWLSWHEKYVRLLVDAGDEGRLREVCEHLLNPVAGGVAGGGAGGVGRGRRDPTFLGHNRTKLLKGVIAQMRAEGKMQRLASEFEQMIEGQ